MAAKKKVVVTEEETVVVKDSTAKKTLKALIDKYKEQSPEKYEAKKEELEAKLKAL